MQALSRRALLKGATAAGFTAVASSLPSLLQHVAADPPVLRDLFESKGLKIGTTAFLGDYWQDPQYTETLKQFRILGLMGDPVAAPYIKQSYGHFAPIADQNNQELEMYNLFWHATAPTDLMEGAPDKGQPPSQDYKDKITNYMIDKSKYVQMTYAKVSAIEIANEALALQGNGKILPIDSGYSRGLGPDWWMDSYIINYKQALALGRDPQTDLLLMYSDWGYELPGTKADFLFDKYARLQDRASQDLGLSNPRIGVSMQLHADFNTPPRDGQTSAADFTQDKLASNLTRFKQYGPVRISEVTIRGGSREQRTNMVLTIAGASIDAGIDALIFWELMTPTGTYQKGDLLFDANNGYAPTDTVIALENMLQS